MIRRLLMLAIVGYALFVWTRRLLRPSTGSGSSSGPSTGSGSSGKMVRDRICDTFVPAERALLLADGSGEHFFCSEACKREHLSRNASPAG